ncbi:TIGR02453 family protein [Pseudoflavonifractor sp. BIOML-A6]|nr:MULTISPECIES: DUF2461 domain-containing protein [unclassified Pseudoflavonifractor]MTQ97734.1 TIGR02453 family protein [Pseudoflavonifractor sp. BIOML-A16]MTR06721.1 TIGR02453 family protein [Pseudoflavonifractor sp. BIOML-A15]MTR33283.1 TIGR02453 family protein [Pseudoflavonifractor sp. BIOML-A14]MTR73973.1 TIGR02453 family protein [Pseudoflavonifractor sp. BIOML-A18]MTS64743.1 TIGR02453 family protein [Pseudoflavonifractor sp. BIOML-A5]MTS72935.1 TIGR02453 family protein [Pseudoflavonifr
MSEIMTFLSGLKANNTLDWMHDHRAEYRAARGSFVALVQDIIGELAREEPELGLLNPGDLISRLNRDTRFSKDKSPYNPAFRAHISTGGKAPIPVGYYLNVTPGGSFFGGGLFVPPGLTAMTGHVREYIAGHGGELEEIVTDPAFAAEYSLLGEKLRKIPRGYPQDFPQGELLKMKSWYLERPFPDEALEDRERFVALAAEKFRAMRPLHAYLNRALQGFRLPERGG